MEGLIRESEEEETKNNNGNTKLILLHPYIQKQARAGPDRVWLLVSFFTLAFLGTLIYSRESLSSGPSAPSSSSFPNKHINNRNNQPLPATVVNTLIHYAARSNYTYHMLQPDIKIVTDVLRKCSALVYYATYFEDLHPEVDAYNVNYATKSSEMKELVASAKEQTRNEYRPVQNLLFSECKLGINDLPQPCVRPGRMSSIFTAGLLTRSRKGGNPRTHVIIHDYCLGVGRICGDEFLCRENRVAPTNMMGHFVLERADPNTFELCGKRGNRTSSKESTS
ncbi:hypothetical protein MLD38_028882 [Melastoma candidum]|uniref:Uncharacterized protein n=1 Tax=Melastoma candidum TaxID=119954 RepID=A0ACB9N2D7_9MYRT|nr:hypothetical protein MLD38_028882 [Melastoma candidum]